MSEEKSKSKPIPTRHDQDVLEMIERLHNATGISKAEIIRRAVKFALSRAKSDGNVDFLLGDPDEIAQALSESNVLEVYESQDSDLSLRVAEDD